MYRPLHIYWAVVSGLALGFCLLLDWSALFELSSREWLGLAAFLSLAVLAQTLAVDSTLGAAKPVKSSIAFLPLLALAVVMPVPAVVLATGSMTAVHETFFRDRSWPRTAFNTAQTILSYGLAAILFGELQLWLGLPSAGPSSNDLAYLFFPFYGLATTFFLLNIGFVSVGIALRQSERFGSVLLEAIGRGGGNLLYDLLASPVALFAAFLYESFFVGGLLAVVLPLLLIRHSYLSAIQLQQANRDLLRVLVKAIETRDPYTSGHSQRVSTLARMIAEDYGLRGAVVSRIETAALLHDIGKIDALYAEIIAKSSSLSDEELKVIRTHATKGADILQSLTSLDRDVIAGVRHHHERYDGRGYPEGLIGKQIPLAARIIMVCDSVDAMLSDRPYRRALPVQQVRGELKRCAGSQFDPDLVDAILRQNTLEKASLLVDRAGAASLPEAAAV